VEIAISIFNTVTAANTSSGIAFVLLLAATRPLG